MIRKNSLIALFLVMLALVPAARAEQQVPPLRFAPVGMTTFLGSSDAAPVGMTTFLGVAALQAETQTAEPADEKDEYRLSASTRWIAAKLHMEPRMAALVFDLLNFAILAGAILVALRKVLPKMFRQRGTQLEGQIEEARAATLDAKHRLDVVEERLSRIDEEIVGMRHRAELEMHAEEERFRATLDAERERIVENAEQEISAAGAAARRDLKRLAADLAVAAAERNMKLTTVDDRALISEFAASLGAGKGSQN